MMAKSVTVACCSLGLITGVIATSIAAPPQQERTASWYADNPSILEKVTKLCRDDPGQAVHNPDCINASQAQVLISLREAERRNSGNLTPPSDPRYWPLHPQERSYRLFICDRIPEAAKAANWCQAAYAAKGTVTR
jgi:hypothetical protein